jgi:hypothetical protein
LLVVVLVVEQHLLRPLLRLWAVLVVVETLTALRQEMVQTVELVIQAHPQQTLVLLVP